MARQENAAARLYRVMLTIRRCEEAVARLFTYRGHGWAIAKGVPLVDLFAELFGRGTGVCRGRRGSMHLCNMRVGLIGASGIVGGGLPPAVGSAYAAQVLGTSERRRR